MNWIERGWYNASKLNFILLPLTGLFWLLSSIRKCLFKLGIKQQIRSELPVIVVGNISVGGTGKTPFVIYLVELLQLQGFKPAIVSRGYGANKHSDNGQDLPFPRLVSSGLPTNLTGDEPKLLHLRTQCPVVIGADRAKAVQFVHDNTDANIVISDDGLQHYKMARDIEIVLLDAQRMFGNGWLLPVGPLRELPSRLKSVDLTLVNSGTVDINTIDADTNIEHDYRLCADAAYNLLNPASKLAVNNDDKKNSSDKQSNKVHLVSGIGNPQRFLTTAESMGYQVESTLWFADHHQFSPADFDKFTRDDIIVMTEKDAVKCQAFAKENWFVLPISAVISNNVEQQLIELIKQLPVIN
ncbi:tetraacyldisaccharide 4'-kinase [Psychrosphaera saromensis]|uniref:Tetraacyldisaccharide 4'-kinase n=1 Tax=Psychrosphaera saromensis TaxID=716813 RepID=A0A2S7UXD8_9GAMM|nr:tetraacyldisaccharide 4'-kinase [Psychrosphaera saromensis]PQJ54637.1 tetraacyldisaccharide 4'-kinase [Psychrosphaera saromensis]GHB58417.1 tetraacyldisaccharide 4'-kinase [Psychrosphaera saromensis]GLQ14143.1 tetraacyldisaccharide 4'-kinase [Psychrosphaera saromensis]